MNKQNSVLKDAADDEIEEGEIIDDDDDEADKLLMISDGEIVDYEDDKIYTKKFKEIKSRRYDNFRNGNRSTRPNVSWRTSYPSEKKHKFSTTTDKTIVNKSKMGERKFKAYSNSIFSISNDIQRKGRKNV
uniref:Uncharacterized protein n=1 Tax=Panagrolaimus sp. ES5 TaxID=591445 RepID=A0AC34FAN8_9BILA